MGSTLIVRYTSYTVHVLSFCDPVNVLKQFIYPLSFFLSLIGNGVQEVEFKTGTEETGNGNGGEVKEAKRKEVNGILCK